MMIIQEMSEIECSSALAHARLGRLACARDNHPYIVPVYFVYEANCLYGFTTLGQKVEWMRSNPLVCVEIDEVKGNEQWTSILTFGRYEELTGASAMPSDELRSAGRVGPTPMSSLPAEQELRYAHELLQKAQPDWYEPACASSLHRRPVGASTLIYYRIRIDRISGRRATPSSFRAESFSKGETI